MIQREGNQPFSVLREEVRMGYVGRPFIQIMQEQIGVLRNRLGFRWADIARMFGVSIRTINCRRQEFGMPLGQEHNFSNFTDAELDSIVREILSITPQSGLGLRRIKVYMTRNFLSPSWKDLLKLYNNFFFSF